MNLKSSKYSTDYRGDIEKAERCQTDALEVQRGLAPGSMDEALRSLCLSLRGKGCLNKIGV
jgi:hypothetical protein